MGFWAKAVANASAAAEIKKWGNVNDDTFGDHPRIVAAGPIVELRAYIQERQESLRKVAATEYRNQRRETIDDPHVL